jgi:hypothetical protein
MTDSRDQHETYGHTRRSEAEAMLAAIDEITAQRDDARRELDVMTHEHRLACVDRDAMQRERDEARRLVIEADWCKDPAAKWPDLWAARGWPVPDPETTVLTCPYCDYREVVHAKPSPSDHAPCWSCNTRDYGE